MAVTPGGSRGTGETKVAKPQGLDAHPPASFRQERNLNPYQFLHIKKPLKKRPLLYIAFPRRHAFRHIHNLISRLMQNRTRFL